jgi:sulfopropanediol 3-dehydrogenase
MAVTYLKKAQMTPQTGTDETRRIVAEMMAKIEAGGEAARPCHNS